MVDEIFLLILQNSHCPMFRIKLLISNHSARMGNSFVSLGRPSNYNLRSPLAREHHSFMLQLILGFAKHKKVKHKPTRGVLFMNSHKLIGCNCMSSSWVAYAGAPEEGLLL